MKHSKYLFLIAVLIFSFAQITTALAGSEHNVWGRAWSENIGWISFNNTSGGGGVNYGVNIDTLTGKFSGYAWAGGGVNADGSLAPTIGWITFNRSETGAPPHGDPCPDGTCVARADFDSKEILGWARVLANGGGWDGWIKFKHQGAVTYIPWIDATVTPSQFKGWAWSDVVLGWVSFNRSNCDANEDGFSDGTPSGCPSAGTQISNYKVFTSFDFKRPPNPPTNLTVTQGNYCFYSYPPVYLSWEFSDPDPGDNQSAYQVQIDNNSDFTSIEIDSGKVVSEAKTYSPTNLSFRTTYYWRVRVWDSTGKVSDWAVYQNNIPPAESFTTSRRHPWPDFIAPLKRPSAGETVTFIDKSRCWDAPGNPYDCKDNPNNRYVWNFGDGTICDSNINPECRGDVKHTYTSTGEYDVSLSVTDNVGGDIRTCTETKGAYIDVQLPIPEYKEIPPVPPVSAIKNFFAGIFRTIRNYLNFG